MKIIRIISIIFFSFRLLNAQILIPFLGENGKYGYATEDGKLVIEPRFDNLRPINSNFFYVNSSINGETVYLLQNGKVIPNMGCKNLGAVLNDKVENGIDTLRFVYAIWQNSNIRLVDARGDSTIFFTYPISTNYDWWRKEKKLNINSRSYFFYGLAKIQNQFGDGGVNFIDLNFKTIFPKNVTEGCIIDSNYLFLADGQNKIAIANRTGEILTPYQWDEIQRGGKSGYFIINAVNDSKKQKARVGLIDANGKLIIDTIFNAVHPLPNRKFLQVQKDGKVGLMDYEGKTILPMTQVIVDDTHSDSLFIVAREYGKYNIEDVNGSKLLAKDADFISFDRTKNYAFYSVVYGRKNIVLDTGFQRLAVVHEKEIDYEEGHDGQLIMGGYADCQSKKRLYGSDLKMVSRRKFNRIDKFGKQAYLVHKHGLMGLINKEGKVIIPVRQLRYTVLSGANDSVIVWCQPIFSRKWSAYDTHGNRLDIAKRKIRSTDGKDYYPIKGEGDNRVITLKNGREIPLPVYLRGLQWGLKSIDTDKGKISIWAKSYDNLDGAVAVNESFESIMPKDGFLIKENALNWYERIKVTGYLTVFQKIPKREDGLEGAQQDTVQCGVMDASGAWVLPPKKGVRYIPMSKTLIAELPYNEAKRMNQLWEKPFLVHKVQKNGTEPIEFNSIAYDLFDESKAKCFLTKRIDSQTQLAMGAYMNSRGELLTPYHILDGSGWLSKTNLVTIKEENGNIQQAFLEASGKITSRLGAMFHARLNIQPYQKASIGYLTVYDASKLPNGVYDNKKYHTNEELLKIVEEHGLLQGLIDSVGKLVLPFNYKHLAEVVKGKLFSSENENGLTQLMAIDGHEIYRFGKEKTIRYFPFDSGNVLLSDGEQTILLSADLGLVRVYPYGCHAIDNQLPCNSAYFQSKDKDGKVYWVRIDNGMAFK